MLFNLCVGTAVGIEISSQWWPEKTTLIQKKTYFGFFFNMFVFYNRCIWSYWSWEVTFAACNGNNVSQPGFVARSRTMEWRAGGEWTNTLFGCWKPTTKFAFTEKIKFFFWKQTMVWWFFKLYGIKPYA